MKQGRASSSGPAGHKTEPKSRAVSIDAVSQLGVHQHNYKSVELYKGRGYSAPSTGASNHKSGSQGKR